MTGSASEMNDLANYGSVDEYFAAVRKREFIPQIGQRVVIWPPGRGFRGAGTVIQSTTNPPGTPEYPVYFVEYDHGGGAWIGNNSLYPEE